MLKTWKKVKQESPIATEVDGRRQRVRRYHNGRYKDSLGDLSGGLPDVGSLFSNAKVT